MSSLTLAVIHALFLIAIALRLGAIGYPNLTIMRLCFFSMALWPVVFFIGFVLKSHALVNYGGLTAILSLTLLVYLFWEMRRFTETDSEQKEREATCYTEQQQHEKAVAQNQETLANMIIIKSYVGDAMGLQAISDIQRLKDAHIPCRIEGSLVKVLFVAPELTDRVAELIQIDVSECASETSE